MTISSFDQFTQKSELFQRGKFLFDKFNQLIKLSRLYRHAGPKFNKQFNYGVRHFIHGQSKLINYPGKWQENK